METNYFSFMFYTKKGSGLNRAKLLETGFPSSFGMKRVGRVTQNFGSIFFLYFEVFALHFIHFVWIFIWWLYCEVSKIVQNVLSSKINRRRVSLLEFLQRCKSDLFQQNKIRVISLFLFTYRRRCINTETLLDGKQGYNALLTVQIILLRMDVLQGIENHLAIELTDFLECPLNFWTMRLLLHFYQDQHSIHLDEIISSTFLEIEECWEFRNFLIN